MWQRFTQEARDVVYQAQTEAANCGSNFVSSEHLLLAVLAKRETVGARLLDKLTLDLAAVEAMVRAASPGGGGTLTGEMHVTGDAHRSFDFSYDESRRLGDNYIGTGHFLLGLIRESSNGAAHALAAVGIDLEKARQALAEMRENTPATTGTWQLFTRKARRAVFFSQEEAARFNLHLVSTEHLLLGMLRDEESFTEKILRRFGASREAVRAAVDKLASRGERPVQVQMQLSPGLKRAIELAREEAGALDRPYIGHDFLVIGLIREDNGLAARILADFGITLEDARDAAAEVWSAGLPQFPSTDTP